MKGEAQKRRKRWPISWLQEEEETRYQEGSSSNPGTGYYLPGWIFLIFVYNENVLIEKTCTKLDPCLDKKVNIRILDWIYCLQVRIETTF